MIVSIWRFGWDFRGQIQLNVIAIAQHVGILCIMLLQSLFLFHSLTHFVVWLVSLNILFTFRCNFPFGRCMRERFVYLCVCACVCLYVSLCLAKLLFNLLFDSIKLKPLSAPFNFHRFIVVSEIIIIIINVFRGIKHKHTIHHLHVYTSHKGARTIQHTVCFLSHFSVLFSHCWALNIVAVRMYVQCVHSFSNRF